MAQFLKSYHAFDGILTAVYDVMYTKGIPVDEQDLLFSVTNVYVLKIMSDLKPKFEETFLRQAEKTDLVVSREVNMSDFFCLIIGIFDNIIWIYFFKIRYISTRTEIYLGPLNVAEMYTP